MRPVLAHLCPMAALFDSSLDLEAFAMMNDALDARGENEARAREAVSNGR